MIEQVYLHPLFWAELYGRRGSDAKRALCSNLGEMTVSGRNHFLTAEFQDSGRSIGQKELKLQQLLLRMAEPLVPQMIPNWASSCSSKWLNASQGQITVMSVPSPSMPGMSSPNPLTPFLGGLLLNWRVCLCLNLGGPLRGVVGPWFEAGGAKVVLSLILMSLSVWWFSFRFRVECCSHKPPSRPLRSRWIKDLCLLIYLPVIPTCLVIPLLGA